MGDLLTNDYTKALSLVGVHLVEVDHAIPNLFFRASASSESL